MKKIILSIVFLIALTTSSFAQDPYLGEIRIFPYPNSFLPVDWLPCEGQTLNIQQYTALYSLIGTQFGGDGRTTFMLPDLRGKVVVGYNAANQQQYGVGKTGGAETVTLAANQIPVIPHTHATTVTDPTYTATATGTVTPGAATAGRGVVGTNTPVNNYPLEAASGTNIYSATKNTAMGSSDLSITVNVTPKTPGGVIVQPTTATVAVAHENRMPYLTLRYFICTQGIYPQRQ